MLHHAERVGDYAERRQQLVGVCRSQGCWRKVVLDPHNLVQRGYGALPMRLIQRFWLCQRFDSCGLEFASGPEAMPLKLGDLTGLAHVRIRLRCQTKGCGAGAVVSAEAMIAALEARKQGGHDSDPLGLGALMSAPCKSCGQLAWVSEVLWADSPAVKESPKGASRRFFEDCGYDLTKADWVKP